MAIEVLMSKNVYLLDLDLYKDKTIDPWQDGVSIESKNALDKVLEEVDIHINSYLSPWFTIIVPEPAYPDLQKFRLEFKKSIDNYPNSFDVPIFTDCQHS
jgi:hypothetical protein